MIFAIHAMLVVLLCCLAPLTALAAPTVYPVKEVFGFESPALTARAPVFAKWVATRGAASLEKEFDAAFRKEFGSLAAENVTDVNKHEVLVASLHLIRASQYVVPKMGNYEVHMPLTLSIVITNPSTGEVIYSFTKTSYAAALLAKPDADPQAEKVLLDQTVSNYAALLRTLIQEVKQGYNPQKIDISVTKIWNGLYILDKGGKSGVARDDNLVDATGTEISVKYVTEDYSVAASLLGQVERGQKFFKYATASTASQFTKPRVLTMHEGWSKLNQYLANISHLFDSEISKESAFTLLPVNEYFRKMLEALARDTYAGKFETTQQRTVPDYMMKFRSAAPRFYTMSEKGKFSINVYEQYILGELLDKQGRIIFSAVGTDRIEDKNVGGMVFGKEARLEVLLKNAVHDLAEQFAKSIKFSHQVHPVKEVDGKSITVDDTSRELRIGQEVTLYRNIGRVDGIKTDVVIPIWQASVIEADKGKVKLDLVLPMLDKGVGVSRDDIVIVDSVTAASTAEQSETSVSYCTHTSPKLGELDIDDFKIISHAFGYRLPYTLYDTDEVFSRMVHEALRDGGFKDTLKLGKVDTAGRCLLPVHKATMEKNKCDQGVCSHEVSLLAGYRLYAGQDVKGRAGSKTTIKTEDCRQEYQAPLIQGDLSKNALGILRDTILKPRYQ
ncbi:MAG: hypothetical protein WCP20_01290 [Desulfuromonadales bacterium]